MTLLVIVLVFGGLILAHELGHFVVAKAIGVRVDEFSIGFGPRLGALRKGETSYGVRILPLGGFVRMAGMAPPPKDDDSAEAESIREALAQGRGFLNKTVAQRAAIIAAGPAMSFAVALLLFVFISSVIGVPSRPTLTIAQIQTGSPAAAAGLRPGDRIVAIDGNTLHGWNVLKRTITDNPGTALEMTIEKAGRRRTVRIVPKSTPSGGLIGVVPVMAIVHIDPLHSLGGGLATVWSVISGWFVAIGMIVHGHGGSDFMGPVGIGQVIGQASDRGAASLLFVAGVLSANLGLINLLPIPALDGSRLMFIGLEWLRGRPVDPEKENFIHFVGFALLILLSVVVTYRDVLRLTG